MRHTLAIAALLLVASSGLTADDWPGLWGPSRTATTAGDLRGAKGEVEVAWRRPVAGGYSEIAVAKGRAYTLELREGVDYITALDASTGRQQCRCRLARLTVATADRTTGRSQRRLLTETICSLWVRMGS